MIAAMTSRMLGSTIFSPRPHRYRRCKQTRCRQRRTLSVTESRAANEITYRGRLLAKFAIASRDRRGLIDKSRQPHRLVPGPDAVLEFPFCVISRRDRTVDARSNSTPVWLSCSFLVFGLPLDSALMILSIIATIAALSVSSRSFAPAATPLKILEGGEGSCRWGETIQLPTRTSSSCRTGRAGSTSISRSIRTLFPIASGLVPTLRCALRSRRRVSFLGPVRRLENCMGIAGAETRSNRGRIH